MGLCAGFAGADFKPICWGKIGLVYQPRFIVHILFVNPTNYTYFPIAIALFFILRGVGGGVKPVFSLLPTQTHTDNRRHQKRALQQEANRPLAKLHGALKCKTTAGGRIKARLFARKARAMKRCKEDHMVGKTPASHALQPETTKPTPPRALSHSHLEILIIYPPVLNQKSGWKRDVKKKKKKEGSIGAHD